MVAVVHSVSPRGIAAGHGVPAQITQAAAAAIHPALAVRVAHAAMTGSIPSLIVSGGSEGQRSVTAAAYLRGLAAGKVLSRHKAARASWIAEPRLPEVEADPAAFRGVLTSPLLVVTEVGSVCRADLATTVHGHAELDLHGYAPHALEEILRHRAEHLPTVLTTALAVGNPPVTEKDLDTRASHNYALGKAITLRAEAGWTVPSRVTGYDPDAQITDPFVVTLRQHLGERGWWRICLPALATAVDASDLHVGG
jgi:hypothetical protein